MRGRPVVKNLKLVAVDNQDHTITVMIDGVRYEYWLTGSYTYVEHSVRTLIKYKAYGKALNLLKAWSRKSDLLDRQ
jgi:hypothetical protein